MSKASVCWFALLSVVFEFQVLHASGKFERFDRVANDASFLVQPEGKAFLVYANPAHLLQLPSEMRVSDEFAKHCRNMNVTFVESNKRRCEQGLPDCDQLSLSRMSFFEELRSLIGPRNRHPRPLDPLPLRDLREVQLELDEADLQEIAALYPEASAENVRFMEVKSFSVNAERQLVRRDINSLSYLGQLHRLLPPELVAISTDGMSLSLNGFDLQCDYAVNGLRPIISAVELQFGRDVRWFDSKRLFQTYNDLDARLKDVQDNENGRKSVKLSLIRKGMLLSQILIKVMPELDLSDQEVDEIISLFFDRRGELRMFASQQSLVEAWDNMNPTKNIALSVVL